MSKPILAYQMHPAVTKDVLLAEMAEHRKHDRLVAGSFGNDHDEAFRGCSVGCLNFSINRLVGECKETSSFEHLRDRAGFPVTLVSLHERLFEWLPAGRRDSWPTEFLEAIAPGADLTLVPWQFLGWLYAEKMVALFPENDPYQARAALAAFGGLLQREGRGDKVSAAEWRRAANAGRAAIADLAAIAALAARAALAALADLAARADLADLAGRAAIADLAAIAALADLDKLNEEMAGKLIELLKAAPVPA